MELIDLILTNTSAVTAVNLRIVSITNITAVAPNGIALPPTTIIPRSYGNLAGGQGAASSFIFKATAGSIEVPFSFAITYLADNHAAADGSDQRAVPPFDEFRGESAGD